MHKKLLTGVPKLSSEEQRTKKYIFNCKFYHKWWIWPEVTEKKNNKLWCTWAESHIILYSVCY